MFDLTSNNTMVAIGGGLVIWFAGPQLAPTLVPPSSAGMYAIIGGAILYIMGVGDMLMM